MKATHIIAALALIVAWVPLIAGLARRPSQTARDGTYRAVAPAPLRGEFKNPSFDNRNDVR